MQKRSAARHSQPDEADAPDTDVAGLVEDLAKAKDGDTDAFWRLVWNLQLEPGAKTGQTFQSDDIREFPGVRTLGTDPLPDLVDAAEQYVQNEVDHRDTWLGSNYWDYRAFAGYLALALLTRTEPLRIPDYVWTKWLG